MVQIEKIEYAGWPNCYRIANGEIELVVTSDVGPRIIRFGFPGDVNELYENPAEVGKTGGAEWRLYGGHRLWHAPEDTVRTYVPDNSPCEVTRLDDGLILTAPAEVPAGLQKTLEIRMSPDIPKVTLLHKIKNISLWPITMAPWAITVMAQEGTAIIPLTPHVNWPKILLPTHSIAFWSYTSMTDARFTWGDSYVMLRQAPITGKEQKVGFNNAEGWAAYLKNRHLFVKSFDYFPDLAYPDRNCNFECFTNRDTLEMESLAPIQQVAPGQEAAHREAWQLFKDVNFGPVEQEIKESLPKLLKT